MPRRSRRSPAVLVAAALFSGAALLAVPSSGAAGQAGGPSIPGPGSISLGQGLVSMTQVAAARRSKVWLEIGPDAPVFAGLYFPAFNGADASGKANYIPCSSRPGVAARCVVYPFAQPECAKTDADRVKSGYFKALIYPLAPNNRNLLTDAERGKTKGVDIGKLASFRVRMLAFGGVPATATVELRTRTLADGSVEPLVAHIWQVNLARPSCDPKFTGAAEIDAFAEGKVEIRLTDLAVDGVPVEVGPSCRTRTPADLQLWGEVVGRTGYLPGNGGNLGGFKGLHGPSLGVLDDPVYRSVPGVPDVGLLQGRRLPASTGLTIPPFTGCGSGGEDISPIVTAMASGPDNPIRVTQSRPAILDQGIDLEDFSKTPITGTPIQPLDVIPKLPERPPLPAEAP